jgi:acyl dehydratase
MSDATELRPGDVARRTRTVRAEDIGLFTELTGDRNPVHYDADLAARSRFGGIVVQGGVTTGLLNALVAEDLPGPGSVFLHVDWSFPAPVRPGDVLTAEARVVDVRPDKPICTLATTIRTADGTVVVDGTAVVWRDPVVRQATEQRGTQRGVPEQPVPTMEGQQS